MNADSLVDVWWHGVELWYNHGDYRAALDVWFQAADATIVGLFDSSGDYGENFLTTSFSINAERIEKLVKNPEKNQDEQFSRLLLFLAGCALDSCDLDHARQYLDATLMLCNVSCTPEQCGSIVVRAAHEYSSLFAEDSECKEPQRLASELFQELFQKRLRAPFLVQDLPSKPFYPPTDHPPWCRILEYHSRAIQEEFEVLWNSFQPSWNRVGSGNHRDGAGQHDGSVARGGEWKEVVLFAQSGAQPELAPRTAHLLREHCMDEVVSLAQAGAGEVIFSVLRPGTRIEPHTASHNLRLTAHLGLKVPADERCYMRVDGVEKHWYEGKVMVFDDSFEHSVVNDTTDYRAVLLLRFWHPFLLDSTRKKAALAEVLTLKEEDKMRRHNPPVPSRNTEIPRGMKKSFCERCSSSGFDSIRVDRRSMEFYCTCGCSIVD